jgi:uncharacterized tellurite resistance protein B-like protein
MPPRLFAFAAALLLPATLLLARAGGGESYSGGAPSSGGGSSDGGGSGGGGGDLWFIFDLIRLAFYYPKIGIPLLAIVAAFMLYGMMKGKDAHQTRTIRQANRANDQRKKGWFVQGVQVMDPAFTAEIFLARVEHAFHKIQQAWSAQDLTPVRPFISDAVHERFHLQFDEQRALGYRNQMSDVVVQDVSMTHAQFDTAFDELHVRIQASAVDRKLQLGTDKVISGNPKPTTFVEVWSFLRRRGVKTDPDKPGLIEGNCPNCAGAIAVNQSANCQYCGALLRSGQFDWVLTEITQEFEFQAKPRLMAPGVLHVKNRDLEFNTQQLEDKASVVFWRKLTADRRSSTAPLAKAALPEYLEAYDRDMRARRAADDRTWYGEVGVGSVEVLGVLPADPTLTMPQYRDPSAPPPPPPAPDAPFDRALVEVRWSGTRFTTGPDSRPQRHEASAVSRLLLVLARKAGVQTDPGKQLSSAHCPNCGAPETGGSTGGCDSCGATLNDGSITWALADAIPMTDPRASALLDGLWALPRTEQEIHDAMRGAIEANYAASQRPAPADPARPAPVPAPAAVLAWMVRMTASDGDVAAPERELLASVARKHNVPGAHLDQLIAAARSGALDVPAPADDAQAREHLQAMARAALADGKISRPEYALLQSAGQRLGLSDYDVQALVKRVRTQLYADSRAALRSAPNGAAWATPPAPPR